MLVLYNFVIVHQFSTYNSVNEPSHWPDYKQGWEEVDCLSTLQWKFCNLSVGALCLPEVWQWVTLNMYRLCFACVLMLQYLQLKERGKTEARAEKWPASLESSQIGTIEMQKKKCRFTNSNLKIQKRLRERLLEILKGHGDLQGPVPKVSRDDLKDFESSSEPPRGSIKSFEDASEGEIEPKALSEDLNEDQLETEWIWLRPEKMQQRLSQNIICDYVWEKNS